MAPLSTAKESDLPSDATIYTAAAAVSFILDQDVAEARRRLTAAGFPAVPVHFTEYNSMFTLGAAQSPWPNFSKDAQIKSHTGLMYIASALIHMSSNPDVQSAAFWSASGNGNFGAITTSNKKRLPHHLLSEIGRIFEQGRFVVPFSVTATSGSSLSFSAPGFGPNVLIFFSGKYVQYCD